MNRKFSLALCLALCFIAVTAKAQFTTDDFIITVKTDNVSAGSSGIDQYRIPAYGQYMVYYENVSNASINGSTAELNNSQTITLPVAGTYKIGLRPSGITPLHGFVHSQQSADTLKLLSVEQWGTAKWNSLGQAFYKCANLSKINATDKPDLSLITQIFSMFNGCRNFIGGSSMNSWNTSTVTDMNNIFSGAEVFNQDISFWNTSNVTNMSSMFSGAKAFNQPIGNWNVSKVSSMSYMFYGAKAFNQPIGTWNTSSVIYMQGMFYDASNFNQSIGNWNVSSAKDMYAMFYGAVNFNQDINSWNTGNVTNMSYTFSGAAKFNKPIDKWNTSNVTNMSGLFYGAANFNQPIDKWNTGSVRDLRWAFFGAAAFNNSLNSWDVTSVYSTYAMFNGAMAFNQSLSNWKLNAIQDAGYMFANSGMDCNNYSKTLIGWAGSVNRFSYTVSFNNQQNRTYGSSGQTARNILINDKGWNITGDNYNSACIVIPDPVAIGWGAMPVTGSVKTNTWFQPVQPLQYVRRHYEITPENNPGTSTGRVVLFFSNQDFKDYNSQNPAPALLLPDKDFPATMEARKANLLIEKRGGTSADGSGLPGSYPGVSVTINPDDENIIWNSDDKIWEVTFDVTGFSGFFVKTTGDALPVDFGEINATIKGSSLFVNWRTLSETNNSHFEIEASIDGKAFVKIGEVKSNAEDGTSASPISYQFSTTEQSARATAGLLALVVIATVAAAGKKRKLPVYVAIAMLIAIAPIACTKNNSTDLTGNSQKLFIRIKQVDKDGTFKYSKTVQAVQE